MVAVLVSVSSCATCFLFGFRSCLEGDSGGVGGMEKRQSDSYRDVLGVK